MLVRKPESLDRLPNRDEPVYGVLKAGFSTWP